MIGSGACPEPVSRTPGTEGAAAAAPASGTEPLLVGAFGSNPAGLALLEGEEFRFAAVNPAYRALMPSPERDPVGRRYDEVWPAEDPAVLAALRRTLLGGE
ncbi:MAG TPA: PAS domain-containing protein, partial [Anaeromyxobacter sp.]